MVILGHVVSVGVPVSQHSKINANINSYINMHKMQSNHLVRHLTKYAEYKVELILYGRSRKQWSARDHLIKNTAHTP